MFSHNSDIKIIDHLMIHDIWLKMMDAILINFKYY